MKNFIDTVQNVILDIRYENAVLEMIDETVKADLEDLDLEPMSEEEYQNFLKEEEAHKDKYGNVIGAYPILYGPIKTLSNVRNI